MFLRDVGMCYNSRYLVSSLCYVFSQKDPSIEEGLLEFISQSTHSFNSLHCSLQYKGMQDLAWWYFISYPLLPQPLSSSHVGLTAIPRTFQIPGLCTCCILSYIVSPLNILHSLRFFPLLSHLQKNALWPPFPKWPPLFIPLTCCMAFHNTVTS